MTAIALLSGTLYGLIAGVMMGCRWYECSLRRAVLVPLLWPVLVPVVALGRWLEAS